MEFHSFRDSLTLELHARPIHPIAAPMRVTHLAVHTGEGGGSRDVEELAALCRKYGVAEPSSDMRHYTVDLGPFTVKWERHLEFTTYTFLRSEPFEHPFEDSVFDLLPSEWAAGKFGEVLVAIHLAITTDTADAVSANRLSRWFDGNEVFANVLEKGRIKIFGDMRTHDDGFDRLLIQASDLGPELLGQTVQRVLELATYWRLALLSLPIAREASPKLEGIERGLASIARELAAQDTGGPDETLLERLTDLSSELENIIANSSYRYGASTAYFELVENRLRQLDATSLNGYIHMFDYLMRRIDPAMRTCWSVQGRQEAISQRASRLSSLLRTGIELKVEQQNRDLLDSMNRRAAQSLAMQRTVEGLSVVAVSYYALGLLKYLLDALAKMKVVTIDPTIASAVLLPFVALGIWAFLRRLTRHAFKKADEK